MLLREAYITIQLYNYMVIYMHADQLNAVFSALADPTRRAILARLERGELTVNELAEPFAMTQPAISKHIKVLEGAGLVSRGRVAQSRPCKLEAAPLKEAAAWIERYRHFWDSSFGRLDDYLVDLQKEKQHERKK
jgi:DNA-binding transcriptional ArsR family regulator